MNKLTVVGVVIIVAAAGISVGRWSTSLNNSSSNVKAKPAKTTQYVLQPEPPAFSASEAQSHRESNYSRIRTMDNVLDLPSDFAQTGALYAMAGRADQPELENLIVQSLRIADRFDRAAALDILFSRYTELDPNACVDYLISLEVDIDDRLFRVVFEAWARIDINGAVARAKQLENGRHKKRASYAILRITARSNQALLDQVAADLGDTNDLSYIHSEAIGLRANRDPYRAMQEAMSLQSTRARWDAVRRVSTVWARNDPAEALQFLNELKDTNLRRQHLSTVLTRWIEDDPVEAMQFINSHPKELERNEMLMQGLGVYAQVHPEEAMAAALELPLHQRNNGLQKVFSEWAKSDPSAATANIMAVTGSVQRVNLITMVGQSLSMEGADKALSWLDGMDSQMRSEHMSNILMLTVQQDPRGAFEYAIANSTADKLAANLLPLMQIVSTKDPGIVQDYMGVLPADADTKPLYQGLASHMAKNDSHSAIQWASGLTGRAKAGALLGVAQTLAQTDPELAGSLISQLPEQDASRLLQSISTNMGLRDPQAGIAWLDQFAGQAGHTQALRNMLGIVAYENPTLALATAAKLSGNDRVSITSSVLGAWANRDPVAAANWANRADSTIRADGLSTVMAVWGRADSSRAAQFAMTLPAGEAKDGALRKLLSYQPNDSKQAIDIVNAMSSDQVRQSIIAQTYRSILAKTKNQRRANEFLHNVGASAQLREQLLSNDRQ